MYINNINRFIPYFAVVANMLNQDYKLYINYCKFHVAELAALIKKWFNNTQLLYYRITVGRLTCVAQL